MKALSLDTDAGMFVCGIILIAFAIAGLVTGYGAW